MKQFVMYTVVASFGMQTAAYAGAPDAVPSTARPASFSALPSPSPGVGPNVLVTEVDLNAAKASAMQAERLLLERGDGATVHPDARLNGLLDLVHDDLERARNAATSVDQALASSPTTRTTHEHTEHLDPSLRLLSHRFDQIRTEVSTHNAIARNIDTEIQDLVTRIQVASDLVEQIGRISTIHHQIAPVRSASHPGH